MFPPNPPIPPLPSPPRRRRTAQTRVPGYGVGYNPAWPSILSVAHDESDGGRLFVITDRPCVLVSPPTGLPLTVAALSVTGAAEILPVKFRLQMSGAVTHGAAWAWAAGGTGLIDPITNHPLNAATGFCADTPGPYTPPPPAVVVDAFRSADGMVCTLVFDQPMALSGVSPDFSDGAIQCSDTNPIGVSVVGGNGLALEFNTPITPGSAWDLNAQPAWLASVVVVPQDGNFI